jgi:MFS family permease
VTRRLAARIGVGWAYTIGCVIYTAPLALVPLAAGTEPVILAMLFAAEFCSGFGVMILDISIGAIFAAVIPDQLRSRVSGAFQAVKYGTRPGGAAVGGILASVIGIRPTLWISAAGGVSGVLWLLPSPLPRFRMLDDSAGGASPDTANNDDGDSPADAGAEAAPVDARDPSDDREVSGDRDDQAAPSVPAGSGADGSTARQR